MSEKSDRRDPLEAELVAAGDGEIEGIAEPPVVARMVIEIRSDGRRTIARGALEDVATGQKVAIEARGNSPLGLALALARSMASAPALARTAVRALLAGPESQPRPKRPRRRWLDWRSRGRR